MPDISLDPVDATELAELLHFLTDWLVVDHYHHHESLFHFVGGRGYDVDQLGSDLLRFACLLNGNDTEPALQPRPWSCGPGAKIHDDDRWGQRT